MPRPRSRRAWPQLTTRPAVGLRALQSSWPSSLVSCEPIGERPTDCTGGVYRGAQASTLGRWAVQAMSRCRFLSTRSLAETERCRHSGFKRPRTSSRASVGLPARSASARRVLALDEPDARRVEAAEDTPSLAYCERSACETRCPSAPTRPPFDESLGRDAPVPAATLGGHCSCLWAASAGSASPARSATLRCVCGERAGRGSSAGCTEPAASSGVDDGYAGV
jgi:hypothetical protein